MIFIDLETTGLLKPSACDLVHQPKIIEFCAIKTDNKFCETGRFNSLIDPCQPITETITKLTKITNEMLIGKPKFVEILPKIEKFFLGETVVVAHNVTFDMGVLCCELRRLDREFLFPWPTKRICTVEKTFHFKDRRLKLGELYTMATGKNVIDNAHRAESDVLALIDCCKWLVKEEKL